MLEGESFDEVHVASPENTEEFFEDAIEVALDSGAGKHVAGRSIAPRYAVEESAGSRAGQHFVAAGGTRIPNEGQFTLQLRTGGRERKEDTDIASIFQVAKVMRPLWSVGRICDVGFEVKFTKDKATVGDLSCNTVCEFLRKGGLYVAKPDFRNPLHKAAGFLSRGS